MKRKINVPLIAGVALAVLAAIGILIGLNNHTPTYPVVVAKSTISARQVITPNEVEIYMLPASAIPPDGITSLSGVVGKWTLHTVERGSIVQGSEVENASTVTYGLSPSERVFTISATPATGAAGEIVQGDKVDIIAVSSPNGQSTTPPSATTVLQHVTVLKVSTVSGTPPQPTTSSTSGISTTSTSQSSGSVPTWLYSVAVSLSQAEELALIQGMGDTIYLALDPIVSTTQTVQPTLTINSGGIGVRVK